MQGSAFRVQGFGFLVKGLLRAYGLGPEFYNLNPKGPEP